MENLFEHGHALIIGADYKTNKRIHDQVEKDVENISDVILDQNLAGYNKNNVKILLHGDAHKEAILDSIDELIEKANEDSTVLIYYTGHGGRDRETGESYLCPFDMKDSDVEKTSISAEEFQSKLKAIRSQVKILFLDCCHAQGLSPKGSNSTEPNQSNEIIEDKKLSDLDELGKQFFDFENLSYISSCKAEEQSWALSNESFFTQCLVEALRGRHKETFDDPFIRVTEIVQYLLAQVPKRVGQHGQNQHPTFKMNGDHDMILSHAPKMKLGDFKKRTDNVSKKEEQVLASIQNEFEAEGKSIDALKKRSQTATGAELDAIQQELLVSYLKRESLAKAKTMVTTLEDVNVAKVLGDHAKVFQNITGNIEITEGHKKIFNQQAEKIINIEHIDNATF